MGTQFLSKKDTIESDRDEFIPLGITVTDQGINFMLNTHNRKSFNLSKEDARRFAYFLLMKTYENPSEETK